ncbi:hypothetical protein H5410_036066 [Solanum commersonii]|uniref:Uncharacterized protein n=1 Tax=Solanum commersonii TaxID=4109 RepID=A0A9J5Y4C0_SOLCO|nr:hypothetical protein H5410_036066 [Solanum commersonii]
MNHPDTCNSSRYIIYDTLQKLPVALNMKSKIIWVSEINEIRKNLGIRCIIEGEIMCVEGLEIDFEALAMIE